MEEGGYSITSLVNEFEDIRSRIATHISVNFEDTTPVFLFNTHNHFRQNTIVPVSEGVQGFSEAFKNRLVMPLSYSPRARSHLIAHELTHIFQFEALYGGFWRSPRLVKAMAGLIPLWVMEGQAEHIAHEVTGEDWTTYDRMLLRDAYLYDYLYSLRELQNFVPLYRHYFLGYKIAHYAIDKLVEAEGRGVNYRLLRSLRNNLDPMKAFETAVSEFTGLHDFDRFWQRELKEEVTSFVESRDKDEEAGEELSGGDYHSRDPVPDGEGGFFYVSDKWVKNEIYRIDAAGRERKIPLPYSFDLVMGDTYDRIIDYSYESKLLTFIARRNNNYFLFIYDSEEDELQRYLIEDLFEPRSPSVSSDGRYAAFTAFIDNRRDIFLYDLSDRTLSRATRDEYHDFAPLFLPDSRIISSAERDHYLDIRITDPSNMSSEWLTQSRSNEIHPFSYDSEKLIFSSDRDGVFNLYEMKLPKEEAMRLTNIRGGVFYPRITADSDTVASLYFNGSFRVLSLYENEKTSAPLSWRPLREPEPLEEAFKDNNIDFGRARFPYSTDFFLPSFLYSTDVGFLGGGYYMGSDMLNRHSISLFFWGWPGLYNANAQYNLKLGRANVFLAGSAEREEFRARTVSDEINDFSESILGSVLGVEYPLTSRSALTLWGNAYSKDLINETLDIKRHETEYGIGLGYSRSSARIRPFHPVRGSILSLTAYQAHPLDTYGLSFERYETTLRAYAPLFSRRLSLATRVSAGITEGHDAPVFNLDTTAANPLTSRYRLRGYSRKAFRGERVLSASAEMRWLALEDIGWHIHFIWPDINIYSLSLNLFADAGSAWSGDSFPGRRDEWGLSWGTGITLNLFLLQAAPVILNVEFARPVDREKWKRSILFTTGYLTW